MPRKRSKRQLPSQGRRTASPSSGTSANTVGNFGSARSHEEHAMDQEPEDQWGPHKSAKEHLPFLREEYTDFCNKRFWTILPAGLVLPTRYSEPSLVGILLVLPMGWCESPPSFRVATETICDEAKDNIENRARCVLQITGNIIYCGGACRSAHKHKPRSSLVAMRQENSVVSFSLIILLLFRSTILRLKIDLSISYPFEWLKEKTRLVTCRGKSFEFPLTSHRADAYGMWSILLFIIRLFEYHDQNPTIF